MHGLRETNTQIAYELQARLGSMLNWFLDIRSARLDQEGAHRAEEIGAWIATSAKVLGAILPADGKRTEQSAPRFHADQYGAEDSEYRARIVRLLERCQSDLAEDALFMALHGSLADGRYAKGWSDVDTLLILRREAVESPARLVALRRKAFDLWPLFLDITPLQHHGFIVTTETDLRSYPSGFLPAEVLQQSLSVLGDSLVEFHVRYDDGGAMRSLQGRLKAVEEAMRTGFYPHHPHNGICLAARFENADEAMPQLFAFLGYAMTVPAYFLTAIGRPMPKADSFTAARVHFSNAAWAIIDKATDIRRQWEIHESTNYRGTRIPPWVRSILGPDYIEEFRILLDETLTMIPRLKQ